MKLKIEKKIENWQNKLLDLGKRNRLLNYRETKRSSLQIEFPDYISLWKSFVNKEKPLEFPYHDESLIDFELSSSSVKTNQNIKEMQKTLRNLRDKARLANEEQGVNILYLSFGFLKWSESLNSDYVFNSPIILVPVTLTVNSILSPYILSLHEDEIVINPTLCYKLENDFDIKLPDFDEEGSIKLYLESIRDIAIKNNWEVSFDVSLSLLSFLKINMYKDIIRHKEEIENNLIIRTICGDSTASNKIPEEFINFDHDNNLNPRQVFQVVDADSSQQDAILCAKKGISFILQGPPGTGKSQTITNIIAECLAEGKKVLFVSEKMAALEVVHNRLRNVNLDDFCLILHSHKANKRAVLDQLNTVLEKASTKAQLSGEAYQKLDALQSDRKKLNDYAEQLFTIISPLEKSIFEVNGILAHLDFYPEVIFSIKDIDKISQDNYNKKLYILSQFSEIVGRMTDDLISNPWNGTSVTSVSHELRHDIGSKLTALIPKTTSASEQLQTIYDNLSLQWGKSYSVLIRLIKILDIAKASPIIPLSWIKGSELTPLFNEIEECDKEKKRFLKKQIELKSQYQIILFNDNSIINLETKHLTKTETIKGDIVNLKSFLSRVPYSKWNLNNSHLFSLLNETREKSAKMNELVSIILSEFEKEILDIDFNAIYNRYKTEYASFWKIFKKSYRVDKKTIQVHYKKIVKKVSDETVLEIITKLREVSEFKKWFADNDNELKDYFGDLYNAESTDFELIESRFNAFRSLENSNVLLNDMHEIAKSLEFQENNLIKNYQFLYKGLDTQWENIKNSLNWAVSFRKLVEVNNLNDSFVKAVCASPETSLKCTNAINDISYIISNLDIELQWFLSLFIDKENIKSLEMSALADKLNKCHNNLLLLEEWIDFRSARENCKKVGLNDYISKIEELHIDKKSIVPIFKKQFFRLWLDAVLEDYPAVLNFRSRNHERTIGEFSNLDKLQFPIAKAIIQSKLINKLPEINNLTNGFGEIGILKHELAKKRRIMPVRKLFHKIPNLLLTLKPCLMMSPLSVSLFLEADTYTFDTVIFDEASQVCTENAIGAIFRGKQVIIAGDSKQLPPTNFFMASTSDTEYDNDNDEDDEYDDINAYESILDEANLLPEKTLLWHYRSRHEHLIAFSNAKIYRNSLITFPSNIEKAEDNGVEYVFVKDGFYDRGGKRGNVTEAKKVAELIFEHFRKQPNRSLGVIAFGEVQQQAIDTQIRSMRMQDQKYEHYFDEEKNEPFFIKNLENVQGDERDTIIFSIGYAKNAEGVFYMNFGPLSKLGGERRLNVAITRAKFNVKLVGSIMPTDIDIDRIKSDGPKLLRSYIDFAMKGTESLARTIVENDFVQHDSSFEQAVYNFLDRKGYKVITQVGCSGYRIDMAIKHPTLSGTYILGIECDGASYHSARTARERDRLRQDVLENMGWKIYRIWSTDWVKDSKAEGEKLITAIDNAIETYGISEILEHTDEAEVFENEFVSVDNRTMDIEQQLNPYGFEKYQEVKFESTSSRYISIYVIARSITSAIKNEYPLHYELLCDPS